MDLEALRSFDLELLGEETPKSVDLDDPTNNECDLTINPMEICGGPLAPPDIPGMSKSLVDEWLMLSEVLGLPTSSHDQEDVVPFYQMDVIPNVFSPISPAEIDTATTMTQDVPFSLDSLPISADDFPPLPMLLEGDPTMIGEFDYTKKESAPPSHQPCPGTPSPRWRNQKGMTSPMTAQPPAGPTFGTRDPVPTVLDAGQSRGTIKIGNAKYWKMQGYDVKVNHSNPGSFGTHGWLTVHPKINKSQSSDKVSCSLCGCVSNPAGFQSHLEQEHRVKNALLTPCFICDKLVSMIYYNMHMSSVHRVSPSLTAGAWLPLGLGHEAAAKAAEVIGTNQCAVCNKRCLSPGNLRQHVKNCHSETDVRYDCTKCLSSFKAQVTLANHLYRAHEHCGWVCLYCSRPYRYKKDLKSHIEAFHDDPSIRKCRPCGMGFNCHSVYARHVREVHGGVGYFFCIICHEEVNDYETFREHVCKLNQ